MKVTEIQGISLIQALALLQMRSRNARERYGRTSYVPGAYQPKHLYQGNTELKRR